MPATVLARAEEVIERTGASSSTVRRRGGVASQTSRSWSDRAAHAARVPRIVPSCSGPLCSSCHVVREEHAAPQLGTNGAPEALALALDQDWRDSLPGHRSRLLPQGRSKKLLSGLGGHATDAGPERPRLCGRFPSAAARPLLAAMHPRCNHHDERTSGLPPLPRRKLRKPRLRPITAEAAAETTRH